MQSTEASPNTYRTLSLCLITGLSIGLSACGNTATLATEHPKPPPVDFKAYYDCLNRETEMAVKSAANITNYYDVNVKQITDRVMSLCTSRFSNGVPVQQSDYAAEEVRVQEARNSLVRSELERQSNDRRIHAERQAELDAPKLEAESAAASRHYGDCPFSHARELAVASTEPAEVITQATFASCQQERKLISDVHKRYHDTLFIDDTLDAADKRIAGR
jgi:hypothetical protein